MNADEAVSNAYKVWRKYIGFLSATGLWAYFLGIVVGSIVGAVFAVIMGTSPETLQSMQGGNALYVATIASILMWITYNVAGIVGNVLVGEGKPVLSELVAHSWGKYLDVAIGTLMFWMPAITGFLIFSALAVAAMSSQYAGVLSVAAIIVLVAAILITNYLALLPYYAAKHEWKDAWALATKRIKKVYITVLLLNIFYTLIYITIIPLATTTFGMIAYILIDAGFLMHLRHQTFLAFTR